MLTIFFLAPVHSAPQGGLLAKSLVEGAFDTDQELLIAGAATTDADHGRASVGLFAQMNDVDIILTFGKTSRTFGEPMVWLTSKSVVLPLHGYATRLLALPPAASSWWHSPDNINTAVAALRELPSLAATPSQFVWERNVWN